MKIIDIISESIKSPEFQRWFAGSHVVDQAGRPLVVYHGTAAEFDTFRKSRPIRDPQARRYAYNRDRHIGIWFSSSPDSASFFSRQGKTGWQGSHVIPVYLRMVNPLVHDFGGARAKSPEMNLALAARAKAEGRDGIIMRNLRDAPTDGSEDVYIVFRPDQVKSAIGNSTYRTDSPRITESDSGTRIREARVAKTPTVAFLAQVDRLRTDPAKPMQGVGRDYEFQSIEVAFNLRPINDNTIILQSLKSNNPRSGEGSQAMLMLTKWADMHGVTLLLDAGPFSTRAVNPPMDRQTLMSWYMRFGFTPTAENATEMIRSPGNAEFLSGF